MSDQVPAIKMPTRRLVPDFRRGWVGNSGVVWTLSGTGLIRTGQMEPLQDRSSHRRFLPIDTAGIMD